jgi:hypothetical protein
MRDMFKKLIERFKEFVISFGGHRKNSKKMNVPRAAPERSAAGGYAIPESCMITHQKVEMHFCKYIDDICHNVCKFAFRLFVFASGTMTFVSNYERIFQVLYIEGTKLTKAQRKQAKTMLNVTDEQFATHSFLLRNRKFAMHAGMLIVIPNEQRSAANKPLREAERQRKLKKERHGVTRQPKQKVRDLRPRRRADPGYLQAEAKLPFVPTTILIKPNRMDTQPPDK